MRVAFFHHEGSLPKRDIPIQRALANRMIESVRKHLKCELVQMTDLDTPALVENVVRISMKGIYHVPWQMNHYQAQAGEVLFLDTDCVVQRDVTDVFKHDFDVAFTGRSTRFGVYTDDNGTQHYMPFNLGVTFCRSPHFWKEIKERVEKHTDHMMLNWWGGQVECWKIYNEQSGWNFKILDAQTHNYTPNQEDEDLSGKAIVHYKGNKRKHWQLAGFEPLPNVRAFSFGA